MLSRPLLHRFSDERGQSLVLALLVMTFLAVSLGTVMFFTAGNQRNSNYQKTAQIASSLAEAGVNNAVSVLANPNNSACLAVGPGCTAPLPATSGVQKKTYNGNTVTWWGSLNTNATWNGQTGATVWTVYGQASVPNPTGPSAAPVVKKESAQLLVHAPQYNSFNIPVWNTVYSPLGPTAGCDTSLGQGVNVTVPLYVGGNLCMANQSSVNAGVYVGGYLNISIKQAWIGCTVISGNNCSTPAPITDAHVGSYCQGPSGTAYNPCIPEPVSGGTKDTNIYVANPGTWNPKGPATGPFVGVAAPQICWNGTQGSGACGSNTPAGGWYTYSAPGPFNSCPAGSTGPYPTFDSPTESPHVMNDTYQNAPFNLTPATSYTCKIPGQGELSWDAGTRTLTVAGTIFFDGSVTATSSGNQPIRYRGWGSNGACTQQGDCEAVIFASGDISVTSEKLCAVINAAGTDCDWNNWNPNNNILIFASNGPTGDSVTQSQTEFQGGLFATNTVTSGQGAITEGPLVSGTKTVILGQQFGGSFPPFQIAPFALSQPPGGYYVDPPANFHYGS
jgi:Tfp pilus assembly protein PilX